MAQPLVSVICLCYNHAKYVEEAILSVLNQTYQPIELIVVDDASSDDSVAVIESLLIKYSQARFIGLKENIGNCAAFNLGFAQSKGQFIIDFAADDVLMPDRIEKGVRALESAGSDFGVQFSDALLIDRYGVTMGLQSDKFSHDSIPQGDIYREIIDRYFISAPTMLIRREVLEKLQGYDESLAYEDFDFWVRSSRDFEYLYIPEALVKRRILTSSMRNHQFKKGSAQLRSTFEVCKKIKSLNRNSAENVALSKRIRYEIRVCLKLWDFSLASSYLKLLLSLKA